MCKWCVPGLSSGGRGLGTWLSLYVNKKKIERKGLALSVPPITVLVCGGRPVHYKNPFKSFMDCHVMSHDNVDIPPRSFSPGPPRGPQLDVQRSDASLLALHGYILGSQHGSIGGSLISVSLHLHAPRHTSYRLPAREENLNSYCKHYWKVLLTADSLACEFKTLWGRAWVSDDWQGSMDEEIIHVAHRQCCS